MPHFDFTVTFGNLLELGGIVVVLISLYYAAVGRVKELEIILTQHAKDLASHAKRMERFDDSMVDVVSQVHRILGRLEPLDIRRRES